MYMFTCVHVYMYMYVYIYIRYIGVLLVISVAIWLKALLQAPSFLHRRASRGLASKAPMGRLSPQGSPPITRLQATEKTSQAETPVQQQMALALRAPTDLVMVNSPAEQPFCYEPEEGWKVAAFHYFTDHYGAGYGSPANVFLAENAGGQKVGVSWWMYSSPTAYHGEWEHGRSTLYLRFNCRGPLHDDGSLRALHGTFLQLRPGNYYEGFDYRGRRVKMVPYAMFVVKKEGTMLAWHSLAGLKELEG